MNAGRFDLCARQLGKGFNPFRGGRAPSLRLNGNPIERELSDVAFGLDGLDAIAEFVIEIDVALLDGATEASPLVLLDAEFALTSGAPIPNRLILRPSTPKKS